MNKQILGFPNSLLKKLFVTHISVVTQWVSIKLIILGDIVSYYN